MLCEKCGKVSATTHIRSVINGMIIEKHLCEHCAASEGYSVKGNSISQMLSSMLGDSSTNVSKPNITRCSCCGCAFSDISQSGKCGCPECYNTFYKQLLPYFKRIHGSTKHIGKIPNYTSMSERQESVEELRRLLTQLVSEEKYEDAAVIRDKIKKLEEE